MNNVLILFITGILIGVVIYLCVKVSKLSTASEILYNMQNENKNSLHQLNNKILTDSNRVEREVNREIREIERKMLDKDYLEIEWEKTKLKKEHNREIERLENMRKGE